jgi:RHS repeat-associated protein
VARAAVPVAGSPFALVYTSDRVPGRSVAAAPDARDLGLAGWSLDVLHAYDLAGGALARGDGGRRQVAATVVELDGTRGLVVPSVDAGELYVFDEGGRHLRTYDLLTGAVRHEFGWDGVGLATVTGPDGRVTTIHRDEHGDPTAVVTARGYRTRLGVLDGWLAAIADPAGRLTRLVSDGDGLLTALEDPTGARTEWRYDTGGRLVEHRDPVGATTTLARTAHRDGFTVEVTSSEGRRWSDRVSFDGDRVTRSHRDPAGVEATIRIDGDVRTLTSADGMTVRLELARDPRWGMAAPVLARSIVDTGERTTTVTRSRTVGDPELRATPGSYQESYTLDGLTWSLAYDGAARTTVLTAPTGQTRTASFDGAGRLVGDQVSGYPATTYTYDQGRVAAITVGAGEQARSWRYAYDRGRGDVAVTDPTGEVATVHADAAGHPVAVTTPDGVTTRVQRDELGRVTGTGPAGRAPALAHLRPDGRIDMVAQPPGEGGLQFTSLEYDADGAITRVEHADGGGVSYAYDETGRLSRFDAGHGPWQVGYDDAGLLVSITGPEVDLRRTFDGGTLVGEAWSGPFDAAVERTLDGAGRPEVVAVNGAGIGYEYDDAGRIVRVGELHVAYDEATGLVSEERLGSVTRAYAYNDFGEPVGVTVSAGGVSQYELALIRDQLGRVVERTETFAGSDSVVRAYEYDRAGRLAAVRDDGHLTSYEYDLAGNLVAETSPGGSTVDTRYDERDALVERDGVRYRYDAAGRLAAAGDVEFEYDRLGNLLTVTGGPGPEITYEVDGAGRRVAKRVDGRLVQGFAYHDALRPAAELDATGAVVARFVYGPSAWTLSYVERGGATLLVVTDQTGTPRLLVDAGSGEIMERLETDPWGRAEGASELLPFGFAGGLADPDTGLLRFGARDYDPVTTRWTARDPIGAASGDPNLYRYVLADPVNYVDLNGLWPCDITALGWDVSGSLWISGYLERGLVVTSEGGVGKYDEVGLGVGTPDVESGLIFTCLTEKERSGSAQEQLDKYAGEGMSAEGSIGPFGYGDVTAFGPDGSPIANGWSVSVGAGMLPIPGGISGHETRTSVEPLSPLEQSIYDRVRDAVRGLVSPEANPPDDGNNRVNLCATGGLCNSGGDGDPGAGAGPGPGERSTWDDIGDWLRDLIRSIGDPYLKTANGVGISFQARGEFTALRSDSGDLVIQTRQEPAPGSRIGSINTAIAMQVNGDRVGVYRDGDVLTLRVNGEPTELRQAMTLDHGGAVVPDGEGYVVVWPDHSYAVISFGMGRAINLAVDLSPERIDSVHGLLGPNPQVETQTVETSDGTAIPADDLTDYDTLYRTFGDSWRITQQESLFDYAPDESTATFDDRDFPDRGAPFTPEQEAQAEAVCRRLGVPDEGLAGCVFDVAVTGDTGYAVTAQRFLTGFRPSLETLARVAGGAEAAPTAGPAGPGRTAPATQESTFSARVGDTVSGSLNQPGAEDRHEFTVQPGQILYLRADEGCTSRDLRWRLEAPDGRGTLGFPVCQDLGRYEVTSPGTHTVVVRGESGATGAYRFQILDAGADGGGTIRIGDTVSGTIQRPGAEDRHEFEAQPGQVLHVRAAEDCAGHDLWWRLVDPAGQGTLSRPICQDLGPFDVTRPGTHMVVVSGLEGATGSYTFALEGGTP